MSSNSGNDPSNKNENNDNQQLSGADVVDSLSERLSRIEPSYSSYSEKFSPLNDPITYSNLITSSLNACVAMLGQIGITVLEDYHHLVLSLLNEFDFDILTTVMRISEDLDNYSNTQLAMFDDKRSADGPDCGQDSLMSPQSTNDMNNTNEGSNDQPRGTDTELAELSMGSCDVL